MPQRLGRETSFIKILFVVEKSRTVGGTSGRTRWSSSLKPAVHLLPLWPSDSETQRPVSVEEKPRRPFFSASISSPAPRSNPTRRRPIKHDSWVGGAIPNSWLTGLASEFAGGNWSQSKLNRFLFIQWHVVATRCQYCHYHACWFRALPRAFRFRFNQTLIFLLYFYYILY